MKNTLFLSAALFLLFVSAPLPVLAQDAPPAGETAPQAADDDAVDIEAVEDADEEGNEITIDIGEDDEGEGALDEWSAPDPSIAYAVSGGRALEVWQEPQPGAAVVGTLAAEARDVVVSGVISSDTDTDWWQVRLQDGKSGWVDGQFLKPADESAPRSSGYPLACLGTEPFWSLTMDGDKAEFSEGDQPALSWKAGPWTQAEGSLSVGAITLQAEAGQGAFTALSLSESCSDLMSEYLYPFHGVLIAPGGKVYAGCCARAR